MIIPDMTDVEAVDLETLGGLLPEGWYTCTIIHAEDRIAENSKQTPYIQVELKIVSGPEAGRKIFDRIYLSQAALGIAKAKLDAIRYDTSRAHHFDPALMVGRGVAVYIKHEQGTGKDGQPRTYANVQVWANNANGQNPAVAPAATPKPDDDIPF